MPRNTRDSALLKAIYDCCLSGHDTSKEIAEIVGTTDMTAKRYLKYLIARNLVEEKAEYFPHRFYARRSESDVDLSPLEYTLPRVAEYRTVRIPGLVNHHLKRLNKNEDVVHYNRTQVYVMLALAARSEDPAQLARLATKMRDDLQAVFMDYRFFDTLKLRGLSRTRDAKELFELGEMVPHEATVLFEELWAKAFGQSQQDSA